MTNFFDDALENEQDSFVETKEIDCRGHKAAEPHDMVLPSRRGEVGPESLSDRAKEDNARDCGMGRTTKIMTGTATMRWTKKLWLSFVMLSL
ncbi:hypothetical protein TrLO_g3276 [Triparma laevis f. longispina]|uniref:Uncharacterized protein n=1 Tax=Triparma laevis f. longispina TaxID=1714387 RepID=A0A9W7KZL8_9STRA|nr:hypothetical protein TrLO_g3276 [Triparma laevis f. longispina]